MVKRINDNNLRIFFYSGLIIVSILQAYYTKLLGDEAYYWKYAQELAWGYFDHPPLIAFIIKIGYFLFQNELGVRLVSIFMCTTAILCIENIIKPKDLKLFYTLVLSLGILHFVGFLAIPDSPLLLIACCLLLFYQKFQLNPNWKYAVMLGVSAGLLLLSKYHGLIIILLVILSNIKILKSRYFWLAFTFSFIILIPHILWLFENDFPSFKYHLFERSTRLYTFSNTLEYIFTQPFVFGPFAGLLLLYSSLKYKIVNQFEKTLKWILWGGYIFFFLMTFKGRVEAHWTLFLIIPSLYFGYGYLFNNNKLKKILYALFPLTILLLLFARLVVSVDFFPTSKYTLWIIDEFHNKPKWAKAIHQKSGDVPVLFMNSYRKASLYEFYSGSQGMSLNNIMGRKNQFDIWDYEDKVRGKKVMLIPNYFMNNFDSIPNVYEKVQYTFIHNFQSFSKIKITPLNKYYEVKSGKEFNIEIKINNTSKSKLDFGSNKEYPSYICYQFFDGNKFVSENQTSFEFFNNMIGNIYTINVVAPANPGNYGLYFSIKTGWLPPTINSDRYKVKVI